MTESNEHPRLQIDETRLDEEWQGHAEQAYDWARRAADAGAKADEKKYRLELIAARLKTEARGDENQKQTEAALDERVVQNSVYQQAARQLVDAKREQAEVRGGCDALRDRKHALQDLVELHLAGYFGEPRTARHDWSEVKKRRRKTDD